MQRVKSALANSKDRVTESIETGRRRVGKLMRSVEPTLTRSLAQARELRASATGLSRSIKAGVKAGREAYRRSREG